MTTLRLILGACLVVALGSSCSSSDDKKQARGDGNEGGAGGAGDIEAGGSESLPGGAPSAGATAGSAGASLGGAGAEGGAGNTGEGGTAGGELGGTAGLGGAAGLAGGGSGACCEALVDYTAADGELPSEVACAPWQLVDSAEPEAVSISAGALRFATSADAENQYFLHSAEHLAVPAVLSIEARMKLVSGAGSTPSRGPAGIVFVYGAGHQKNMVQMSATEVFILDGENDKGESITFDTMSDFHTYRIDVDTQAGTFDVFIDDVLELSGDTFADPNNAPGFILFGEGSIYGYGVSEWQYVKHNAYACTE